eukprot:TRINITY_DN17424_c0_g1_i1.p1 TRINITY_DN17424_c0_g1~~TRINITY_DN17424_c0_g1_i1.p1  ORF type:complete len:232 (-),score=54.75 TRINITY_DN17424_c0_g1_i1:2-697(-)
MSLGHSQREATQERVFTRICNSYLRQSHRGTIAEGTLATGSLDDGFLFRALLSTLSGKKEEEVATRMDEPKLRVHKINNLGRSLEFLKVEGVKLVGIGAEDILDHNEKLILGLIWTLILRYHVGGSTIRDAKQDMANFVGDMGITINDFRVGFDWRSLLDIVNNILPGCITDDMLSDDALENTKLVMSISELLLDIPHVVDAEDLIGSDKDERIVLAYLSYYKKKKKKKKK